MILHRLGNKKKIAKTIQCYFPAHRIFIEPFFGAGGLFFYKPKVKHNIVNDSDSDVYNLFQVISTRYQELETLFRLMPIHEDLWKHWRKHTEIDPIRKAARFIFLSNWGYMGQAETLRFMSGNTKKIILEGLEATANYLYGVEFMNCDFRDIFRRVSFKGKEKEKAFIYCDPPYLGTANNYESGFKQQDSIDLFDTLQGTGIRWAMSEFDHPFILEQAKERKLQVVEIGERRNLKNRRMEVLVMNYDRSFVDLALF